MGIGRLEFIRLTGLAFAGVAIDPILSIAINEDVYLNRKLGVMFAKPRGWGFIHVADFGKLKNDQLLPDGLNEVKDEVWETLGEPACLCTKYFEDLPEYKGIFSPTIMLKVTHRSELDDLSGASFEDIIVASKQGVQNLLREFKVLKIHNPYFISGCGVYEIDSEYLFEHVELAKPVRVQMKSIKIEHQGFFYDFDCHQCAEQNQTAHEEFRLFKESIVLL